MNFILNDNIFFVNNYIIQYKSNFIRIINKNTNEIYQSFIKYDNIPFLGYRDKPNNLINYNYTSELYYNYYNYYCNNLEELEQTLEIIFSDLESINIIFPFEIKNYLILHLNSICDYDFYLIINKIK
jgi:hypothetical protein